MNKRARRYLFTIVAINVLAMLFYYSPITLYGYWTDTIFLLFVLILTIFLSKQIQSNRIIQILSVACVFNFACILVTSISIWHGLLPVHLIPKGHFEEKNTYAYFIERGNSGLTSGCYGEIQYQKQIAWLPLLEIKIETDRCSSLDYINIINGT